jgi:hypothetical protein
MAAPAPVAASPRSGPRPIWASRWRGCWRPWRKSGRPRCPSGTAGRSQRLPHGALPIGSSCREVINANLLASVYALAEAGGTCLLIPS